MENLSDGELKALVIKMLTDLIELGQKNEKTSEGYQKWNKAKYPGNQQWQEGNRTQINGLDQKEQINIQPEQNEETRIQKNEERLRNLHDNFNCSNIRIIGVPEGEEKSKELETYLKK